MAMFVESFKIIMADFRVHMNSNVEENEDE